jgi:hypothetical protein
MTKKRIQIYVDDETLRRIELAAAKHNIPITTYGLNAIQQQLEEDNIEVTEPASDLEQAEFQELLTDLRGLHERILQKRGGQPVDVDALLEQLREERDEEALGLR